MPPQMTDGSSSDSGHAPKPPAPPRPGPPRPGGGRKALPGASRTVIGGTARKARPKPSAPSPPADAPDEGVQRTTPVPPGPGGSEAPTLPPKRKPSGSNTLAFEALPPADQQVFDDLAAQASGPTDTAPGVAGSTAPSTPPATEGGAPRQAGSRGSRRRELSSTIAFGAEEIEGARQFAVDAAAKETEAARVAAQAQAGTPSADVPPSSEGGAPTLAFEVPPHVQDQGGADLPPSSEGGARTLAFEVPPHVEELAPTTPPMGAIGPTQGSMPEADSTRTMAFGADAVPPQATAAFGAVPDQRQPDQREEADAPQPRRRSSHKQTIAFSSEDIRRENPLGQTVAFGLDDLEADQARPSDVLERSPSTQRSGDISSSVAGPRQGGGASKPDLASTIAFAPDQGGQFEPAAPASAEKKRDLASTMAFDAESARVSDEQVVDEASHIEVPSGRAARTKTMVGGMSSPAARGQAPPAGSAQPAGTMVGLGQPPEVAAHARAQAPSRPEEAGAPGPGAPAPGAMQPHAPMAAPPAAGAQPGASMMGHTTAPPPAQNGGTKLLVAVVLGSIVVGVVVALGLRFAGVF